MQALRGEQPVRPLAASLASLESPLRRGLHEARNPAAARPPRWLNARMPGKELNKRE